MGKLCGVVIHLVCGRAARAPATQTAESMVGMKPRTVLLFVCLLAAAAGAEVRVFVQDTNGVAWIKYQCTAGEVVRAFALDVRVDRGQIVGISDFFRGESQAEAQGYGIFPAAFRDHITIGSGTKVNWDASDYTPLAVAQDSPNDTLPGLNSSGVTLEFGGLWDSAVPAAVPGAAGTLCAIQISEAATVSLAANLSRGGILSASSDARISPVFSGTIVGPAIIGTTLVNGVITIHFKGGELVTAAALDGPWTATGNTNGSYSEPVGQRQAEFFRVRRPY